MTDEAQALIDAVTAANDVTELGAQAIQDLQDHVADPAKHTDWTVEGEEEIHSSRYVEGVDGESAYALAVADGYVGTVSQWLLTLQGLAGAINLPQLDYTLIDSLKTPVSNPGTADVLMIPTLGKFQFSPTLDYVEDDETVIQVIDSADGVTPVGQWVLTTPAYDWSEAQKLFENAVLWERWEDEELRHNTY